MPAKPLAKPGAPKLQDRPHVEHGDELYFRDSKGAPWTGKVLSHGEHGCTVKLHNGKRHQVRWDGVLGHRRRTQPELSIVDQGEDGFVAKDRASGRLRYIADPLEEDEGDEPMAKALSPIERLVQMHRSKETLLTKALKGAPGLSLQAVTDKGGKQTKRWKKTAKDQPKGRQAAKPEAPAAGPPVGHHDAKDGDHVKFTAGTFKGEGKIDGQPGADGAHIIDSAGRRHTVTWDEIHERAPAKAAKSDSGPRLVVPGKGGEKAKAPEPIAEDHGKHFHTDGASKLDPHKLRRSKPEDPKAGVEADKRMREAGEGKIAKRAPVRVHANEDGSHTIADGHASTDAAKANGWKAIPAHVVQTETTQEGVMKAGAEAVEYLKDWLNKGKGLADQMGFSTMTKPPSKVAAAEWMKPGGMLFIAPIKGEARAKEKVESDYGGDWSRLKDVARCTLAVDTLEELRTTIDKLKASGMVVAQPPKDRYAGDPTGEGYRDVNMIVRAPNGHLMEVQVNTKAMMEAKNEGHELYEKTRTILARNGDTPPEQWSEDDNTEFWHAVDEQKRIYGEAYAKVEGTDKRERS